MPRMGIVDCEAPVVSQIWLARPTMTLPLLPQPAPTFDLVLRNGKIVDHKFSGFGTVVTYSIIQTAPDQFASPGPYVLAIVQLDEGPRMTGQVICDPKAAKIGMKVKSTFRRIATDGESGIIHYGTKFVPAE